MSFKLRTKVEYLMELVSWDKTCFISNLKTLELNAWLLVKDTRIGT